MTEIPAISEERRQDAGYQRRLIEETHDCVAAMRKRIFEGNGELAIVVQMALTKTEQERQGGILAQLRIDLDKQMTAMLTVTQTLTSITSFFSRVGITLLIAIVLAVLGVIAGMITHTIPWFTP
jgi:hypothetical protein